MRAVVRSIGAVALLAAATAAHAQTVQTYAVVCTSPCLATVAGSPVPVAQPAGYVLNMVLWDGVTPFTPPPGTELQLAGSLQTGQTTVP
jgi:hypothetical protein